MTKLPAWFPLDLFEHWRTVCTSTRPSVTALEGPLLAPTATVATIGFPTPPDPRR